MEPGANLFIDPEVIVKNFDLKRGDHVADFGAGHGYFTIPMARSVGGDGKVYAIDIQKSVLEIIRAKAKTEHLLNIELIWTDLDLPKGSKLADEFIDFVLIASILFQAENKTGLFVESRRILRNGGKLGIIEWNEKPSRIGPPPDLRIKQELAKQWSLATGFKLEKEFEAGGNHYGLLFQK